jgi:hypothetical protein
MTNPRATLIAVAIGLVVVACSKTDAPPMTNPSAITSAPESGHALSSTAVTFDGTVKLLARLEGSAKPEVVGVTNLPDGTLLMITLSRKESAYAAQAKASVSGGAFRAGPFSRQGSDLSPGKYVIDIGSPLTALQPASVQLAFGPSGSKLRGPLTEQSPFGGSVIKYSTQDVIAGDTNAVFDATAREQARQDWHQWFIDACVDRCRIVKGVAARQEEPFDQGACYQKCLAALKTSEP